MDFDLAFANGGNQNNNSIPIVSVCQVLGIELINWVIKFSLRIGCSIDSLSLN